MRVLVTLALVSALGAGTARDPLAFFSPSIVLNKQEREHMMAGQGVARVLPASDRQIGLFAAVPVDVDTGRFVAWMRDIPHLNQSNFVPRSSDISHALLEQYADQFLHQFFQ